MRKIQTNKTHEWVETNLEVCARKMEIRRQPIRNSHKDKIFLKICLAKHFCCSASTTRKQRLICYICKIIQTKKSKMNPFQPDEPRNDVLEEVYLKRLEHRNADVKITYDTRRRDYKVVNGTLKKKECVNGSTKLTILSNSKHQYTVTRKRGGVYETNYRNWMEVEKTEIWWEIFRKSQESFKGYGTFT